MKKPIIISDFDGTISIQDVNDTLFEVFGDERSMQIEEEFRSGKIGVKEALKRHYQIINITQQEFNRYIIKNIQVDPYFAQFYFTIRQKGIEIAIVSGGFTNYIKLLLEREGIDFIDSIYANNLNFTADRIEVEFLHNISSCHQPFGVCGNCKYQVFKKHKQDDRDMVFIGDGLTDRCLAAEADQLFAKKGHSLAIYCQENGIQYRPFSNFKDVMERMSLDVW